MNRYVCINLETLYTWVQCDLVSLGKLAANIPEPELIQAETSFENKKIELLEQQIEAQKVANIIQSGGSNLLEELEGVHIDLFNRVSTGVADSISGLSTNGARAARYAIDSARYPTLQHNFEIKL